MTQALLCNTDDRGVTTLILHRPERSNALDGHLMAELTTQLKVLAEDPAIRVLVLSGSGRAFCSGADLDWIQEVVEQGEAANQADARQLAALMQRLNEFPKPAIARVNGAAYGGGAGLIACCDIAIASEAATFAFSEVRLGLVAAVIAPYVLTAMGVRNARRFLLSGERFSANQALAMGLVHQVVEDAALDGAVERQLQALLQGMPVAQTESKRLLHDLVSTDAAILQQTAELTARIRASAEGGAGVRAFLERRKHRGTGTGD